MFNWFSLSSQQTSLHGIVRVLRDGIQGRRRGMKEEEKSFPRTPHINSREKWKGNGKVNE